MLIEAEASDFALLLAGSAPQSLAPVAGDAIAPPDVMLMLAELATSIRTTFAPSAWMIAEAGEIVGLLSLVRPPVDGELHIGYGIAPSRHRRGIAGRAVADLVAWATMDPRVARISAETAVDNPSSQRVLQRNGFEVVGSRDDPDDGALLCWERLA